MKNVAYLFLLLFGLTACNQTKEQVVLIPDSNFAKEIAGKPVSLYTLKNKNGMTAQITNLGGCVVSLWVPDKDGNFKDVVLGYDKVEGYQNPETNFGALIGRYGNRIAKGKFSLNNKEYTLAINNGENSLHGGAVGYNTVVWDAVQTKSAKGEDQLNLHYLSVDGEAGYPGNLNIDVSYTLGDDNSLSIAYSATTDDSTVINLTNHSYFNLNGVGVGVKGKSCNDNQIVMINADRYTPTDKGLIPTGEIASVEGTPMDFRVAKAIGERQDMDFEALNFAGGYDHNYVINQTAPGQKTLAAEIYSPMTGIKMTIETTEPGVQFYAGNFLNGVKGKNGVAYNKRDAFCFETQHYPDAPNQANFPTTVLAPGETYSHWVTYRFSL